MIKVVSHVDRVVRIFISTIAVANYICAQTYCDIYCTSQRIERSVIGLDQENMAVRRDGAYHIQVKGNLTSPAAIGHGILRATALIYFFEAAIRSRARRKIKC